MRSDKSQIRNPHSPTIDFPLPAALCPSQVLHRANWRFSELPLSLPISLSLSLGMDRSELLLSLSVSLFFLFFFLSFFSFFYLLTTLDLWFSVLWHPTHCVILYCVCVYIYIYIYICFFTQPCLIKYNVHYVFSDFCFCVSCYSFIYLLKLNIVGDFTKVYFCVFFFFFFVLLVFLSCF